MLAQVTAILPDVLKLSTLGLYSVENLLRGVIHICAQLCGYAVQTASTNVHTIGS